MIHLLCCIIFAQGHSWGTNWWQWVVFVGEKEAFEAVTYWKKEEADSWVCKIENKITVLASGIGYIVMVNIASVSVHKDRIYT